MHDVGRPSELRSYITSATRGRLRSRDTFLRYYVLSTTYSRYTVPTAIEVTTLGLTFQVIALSVISALLVSLALRPQIQDARPQLSVHAARPIRWLILLLPALLPGRVFFSTFLILDTVRLLLLDSNAPLGCLLRSCFRALR